ncbi:MULTISPECIES: hypothetical protein [Lactobacillus]|uniref:Uncharacterized protein n=1 Tax=Lactobacillus xujianguonis TaxID=2495899 RepID=A0A437SVQ6_9LACO|nr:MULTISPECIES: hypothetical protein [Lactobacillus]RVU71016.1 hypothetical protein EJK17_04740 [Lactobacillus xujianguonis]RVU73914.1 hypothetical protein EJK20_05570 [Lactobacillus xujianguonis]
MHVNTRTFKIKSKPHAAVYLNNRLVGKLNKKGYFTFADLPLNDQVVLYVAQKQRGKLVKSQQITDLAKVLKKKKGTPTIQLQFKQKSMNKLLATNFTKPNQKDFVGGKRNRDYQELKRLVKGWTQNPNMIKYHATVKLRNKNRKRLNYNVIFRFYFPEHQITKQIMSFQNGVISHHQIKAIGGGKLISTTGN